MKKRIAALTVSLSLIVPMVSLVAPIMGSTNYSNRSAFGSYNAPLQTVKSSEVLQAGSVIPAMLVTKLTSDNMGSVVVAVVRQHVYDSVTGRNILIPAGSRLIGEPMQMQGSRINISFQRIIFPNGHSVQIPNFEAIDGIGQSGLKDKYTTHSWLKTRSVLTGAIFAGATAKATNYDQTTTNSNGDTKTTAGQDAYKTAISELISGLSRIAERDASNITPTGTIREGYQFNIILHSDIRIRPYTN